MAPRPLPRPQASARLRPWAVNQASHQPSRALVPRAGDLVLTPSGRLAAVVKVLKDGGCNESQAADDSGFESRLPTVANLRSERVVRDLCASGRICCNDSKSDVGRRKDAAHLGRVFLRSTSGALASCARARTRFFLGWPDQFRPVVPHVVHFRRDRLVAHRVARDAAGIIDLHWHDSRHEAITRLARRLDVLDLARMIGHRDLRSLQVYYNATPAEIESRLDG